jgi:hypothetical protein
VKSPITKIILTIRSCQTLEQLEITENWLKNRVKLLREIDEYLTLVNVMIKRKRITLKRKLCKKTKSLFH